MSALVTNPFPGPQPYRAPDRERFYGRGDMARALESSVLASRCVTVYGPSGAGKSSLVQAAVLPALIEAHEIRVVLVDGWPEGEDASRWLASKTYAGTGLGDVPSDVSPREAILTAAQRIARRSERLLVVYLDQVEQLLYPGRDPERTEALFACVDQLVQLPLGNARVMLSLREDYLGRFRDRLRDRRRLLDHGFRVGPLTVAELTEAVCQTAAAGAPPQAWSSDELRRLMLQVRVPGQAASDQAEAVAAYAQIVCRALFQQRAQGDGATGEVEAEPILRGYLQTTLEELGPRREAAQQLLEEHLVTPDGGRTLRVEKELLRILPAAELSPILEALERAAILHAGEHQGSRYFELGHDWLARMVTEQREQRLRDAEQARREQEQQERFRRERAEAEARLANERARRRVVVAIASAAVTGVAGALGYWAWQERVAKEHARVAVEENRQRAEAKASEALDARITSGVRELNERGRMSMALKLLGEAKHPEEQRDWVGLASDTLGDNALRASLRGHEGPLTAASWSPDGKRVLSASEDGTARVWRADGTGQPVVLPHSGAAVLSAAWSPDGERVLTASEDGTARVWSADGVGQPVILEGHGGPVVSAAWSRDGQRVITVSRDGAARVHAADGTGEELALGGGEAPVLCAAFHPDGARFLTGSADGPVRLWSADATRTTDLRGHEDAVVFLAVSPDGKRVATASRDGTARVWDVEGAGTPVVLQGHTGAVVHVAWSPDSARVATGSADGTTRVWPADGKLVPPIVLKGHAQSVVHVAFRPDGTHLATASTDRTTRLWPLDGSDPLILREHDAPVRAVAWSPDGSQVVTAAGADPAGPTSDHTAKVWSAELLERLRRERRGAGAVRSASLDASGELAVAAYNEDSVRLWRTDGDERPVVLKGYGAPVTSVALSPDGKHLVTSSSDKAARVYRTKGEREAVVVRRHDAEVSFVAWSPEGERVVALSADRTAQVWLADGSGITLMVRHHEDRLTWAAWSPDGARIATTSLDHTARVWKVGSTDAPVVLRGHEGGVLAAAWSPDGKRIVTTSEDETARVWDADSGKELAAQRGHQGAVLRALWSPDGQRVATSSADSDVLIWNADATGTPVALESRVPVLAMRFLEGGRMLLGVASDGTTHAWATDVGALRERLKTAHTACLPADMRALYLGETPDEARARHDGCEISFQRTPAAVKAATATASAPAEPPPAPLTSAEPPPAPSASAEPSVRAVQAAPAPPPRLRPRSPPAQPAPAPSPGGKAFKPPGGTKLE
ncbi:nSTAND1 domain-containing NTPase [Sorangium sp. So ce1151]|uniref:nSTAND1 domain-containing NTPase n=1 Tax=Sorangium sp. So ce1151 TaxID=3133332 RepID=UPI003F6208DD